MNRLRGGTAVRTARRSRARRDEPLVLDFASPEYLVVPARVGMNRAREAATHDRAHVVPARVGMNRDDNRRRHQADALFPRASG